MGNSCVPYAMLLVLLCTIGLLGILAAALLLALMRTTSRAPVAQAPGPVVAQPVACAHAVQVARGDRAVACEADATETVEATLRVLHRLRERRLITDFELCEKREIVLATLAPVPVICGPTDA